MAPRTRMPEAAVERSEIGPDSPQAARGIERPNEAASNPVGARQLAPAAAGVVEPSAQSID